MPVLWINFNMSSFTSVYKNISVIILLNQERAANRRSGAGGAREGKTLNAKNKYKNIASKFIITDRMPSPFSQS